MWYTSFFICDHSSIIKVDLGHKNGPYMMVSFLTSKAEKAVVSQKVTISNEGRGLAKKWQTIVKWRVQQRRAKGPESDRGGSSAYSVSQKWLHLWPSPYALLQSPVSRWGIIIYVFIKGELQLFICIWRSHNQREVFSIVHFDQWFSICKVGLWLTNWAPQAHISIFIDWYHMAWMWPVVPFGMNW